uniref:PPPDE domain-containing protein n=1 Tax=Chromera velia CCMP2878 TaxID=1169474 RepID=A0A0G4HEX5_9ALVE|eukprot:Cvel_26914.t1-p1 / transcript=Cvel_26914.t1 / gene=Cvel_26914 / organism=Chromera_velia_CCMP2878 / gene_product=hypothetical protein / transcript_product=hypothetical protein / location=Cvel_scaffold3273:2049-5051(-) / protein_length=829 / sequence_SO=supercontig / SO=protein_coding / is_pseudo=false
MVQAPAVLGGKGPLYAGDSGNGGGTGESIQYQEAGTEGASAAGSASMEELKLSDTRREGEKGQRTPEMSGISCKPDPLVESFCHCEAEGETTEVPDVEDKGKSELQPLPSLPKASPATPAEVRERGEASTPQCRNDRRQLESPTLLFSFAPPHTLRPTPSTVATELGWSPTCLRGRGPSQSLVLCSPERERERAEEFKPPPGIPHLSVTDSPPRSRPEDPSSPCPTDCECVGCFHCGQRVRLSEVEAHLKVCQAAAEQEMAADPHEKEGPKTETRQGETPTRPSNNTKRCRAAEKAAGVSAPAPSILVSDPLTHAPPAPAQKQESSTVSARARRVFSTVAAGFSDFSVFVSSQVSIIGGTSVGAQPASKSDSPSQVPQKQNNEKEEGTGKGESTNVETADRRNQLQNSSGSSSNSKTANPPAVFSPSQISLDAHPASSSVYRASAPVSVGAQPASKSDSPSQVLQKQNNGKGEGTGKGESTNVETADRRNQLQNSSGSSSNSKTANPPAVFSPSQISSDAYPASSSVYQSTCRFFSSVGSVVSKLPSSVSAFFANAHKEMECDGQSPQAQKEGSRTSSQEGGGKSRLHQQDLSSLVQNPPMENLVDLASSAPSVSIPACSLPRPVRILVYNVHSIARLLNSALRACNSNAGGAYHLSVEIDGIEWQFGARGRLEGLVSSGGITYIPVRSSAEYGKVVLEVEAGATSLSPREIMDILDTLYDEGYHTESYDVYERNCVHFMDEFLSRLSSRDPGVRQMPKRFRQGHEALRNVHNWVVRGELDRRERVERPDPQKAKLSSSTSSYVERRACPRPSGCALRLGGKKFFSLSP